jgi:hypothetical protein
LDVYENKRRKFAEYGQITVFAVAEWRSSLRVHEKCERPNAAQKQPTTRTSADAEKGEISNPGACGD